MPTASDSTLADSVRGDVERLSSSLFRDFEKAFSIWRLDADWVCLSDPALTPSLEDGVRDLLALVLDSRATLVIPLCNGGSRIAVPFKSSDSISSLSRRWVAVADFDDVSAGDAKRLAKMHTELVLEREKAAKADCAVDSMAQQVSSDFEELMLLRGMAEHLQLSDGSDDPSEIAKKLLPALQGTLKCEHLALIQKREHGEQDRVFWAQRALLLDEACFDLILRIGGDGSRPIENDFQLLNEAEQFPNIHELALVPIGGNGWLAAINRLAVETPVRGVFEEIQQGHKFGTFEVTLMTSAASMLTTHFNNLDLLREKQVVFTETVKSLINAVDARDPYTRGHSERVGLFSKRLAHHIGLGATACERIYLSGLLHDIGKIGVSDATLQKPGKLTDEEYDELKKHPDQGWAILSNLHAMQDILPGVLYHHERFDGKGYPCGLVGEDIPIEGRLMSICDSYDAMTSDRPYRAGMAQDKAEAILLDGRGTQWDPRLVDEFMVLMPDIIRIRDSYSPRPLRTRQGRV